MFCPNCKCEYLAGVTKCSDCGIALVPQLDPERSFSTSDGELTRVWYGDASQEFVAVKEELENASIEYQITEPADSIFIPTVGPRMEIWVSNKDAERAKKVLLERDARLDLAELTPEEMESLELPDTQGPNTDEGANAAVDDHGDSFEPGSESWPENWDDDQPVSEVWKGNDEELRDNLAACFRENNIPSRKLPVDGQWRLVVLPRQEARAKEIVREVVEGCPPE